MFCGECGTKNTSGSKFCENCGAKLEDQTKNVNTEPTPVINNTAAPEIITNTGVTPVTNTQQHQPMNKKTKLIIWVVGILIAALFGGYYYVGTLVTPEKIAENYFNAMVSQDANAIYELLNVEETTFTTKKMFKKVLKNTMGDTKVEINNYEVGKVKYADLLKTSASVTITYLQKDSEKSSTMDVKLVKSPDKKWLLYDKWLIESEEFAIATDYEINVEKGSKVKIEGEKLDKKYLDKESTSDSYDKYIIPTMFTSKYKMTIENPFKMEYEEYVNVYTKGYYYSSNYSSNLTEKTKKALTNRIKDDLTNIYNAAIEKKTFEDIKSNYEHEEVDLYSFESNYNDFISDLDPEVTLNKVDYKKVELKSMYTDYDDKTFKIYVTATCDYSITYQYGTETKTHEDTANHYPALTYKYVDGEYKLINIDSLSTYFSKY